MMCSSLGETNDDRSERVRVLRDPSLSQKEKIVLRKFRRLGLTLGFIIQMLSLWAVAWLGFSSKEPSQSETTTGAIFYVLVSLGCWLSLALLPVVWMTPFILGMTELGKFSLVRLDSLIKSTLSHNVFNRNLQGR
jgi:hypothetical protein